MSLAYTLGIAVLVGSLIIAFEMSEREAKKKKFTIWGVTTMSIIAPFLSCLIGLTYALFVGNDWVAFYLIIVLFSVLFLIGIILLFAGMLSKKDPEMVQ